jgi:8-oxo-dGTP diphosphatase
MNQTPPNNGVKQRVAAFLRRAPYLMAAASWVYRFRQEHITAGVVGVIANEVGHILLVEHVFHPKHPWGLPGGWMNRRENPDETICREAREETALTIAVVNPLLISRTDYLPHHLDIAYLCRLVGGEVRLSPELLSYRWMNAEQALTEVPMVDFHRRALVSATSYLPLAKNLNG